MSHSLGRWVGCPPSLHPSLTFKYYPIQSAGPPSPPPPPSDHLLIPLTKGLAGVLARPRPHTHRQPRRSSHNPYSRSPLFLGGGVGAPPGPQAEPDKSYENLASFTLLPSGGTKFITPSLSEARSPIILWAHGLPMYLGFSNQPPTQCVLNRPSNTNQYNLQHPPPPLQTPPTSLPSGALQGAYFSPRRAQPRAQTSVPTGLLPAPHGLVEHRTAVPLCHLNEGRLWCGLSLGRARAHDAGWPGPGHRSCGAPPSTRLDPAPPNRARHCTRPRP